MDAPTEPLRPDRRRVLLGGAGATAGLWLGACAAPRSAPGPSAESDARASELLADLAEPLPTPEPIVEADRAARRARLGGLLAERDLDAFLCEGGATMSYLSGVSWSRSERLFALVVFSGGSHLWLCPAFEEARARLATDGAGKPGGAYCVWQEDEYALRPLCAALRARGVRRLAIDPAFRYGFVDRLATAAKSESSTSSLAASGALVSGAGLLLALRARKEPKEIALLRRANELTQRALVRVAHELHAGLDGAAVGRLVSAAHARLGFASSWNLPLVGPAAALPHGDESAQKLARGDVLLVDCGGSYRGYQSDITRTWVPAGVVGDEVERAWNAVRDAQRRAFEAIRPGAQCRSVDQAARAALVAHGYPGGFEVFTHRLGHGIGLEGHEDPYFDGGSEVVLQSGMTLSDEPGIYLPGRFGVRIEDIVHVTESGAEVFGSWQASARSPA